MSSSIRIDELEPGDVILSRSPSELHPDYLVLSVHKPTRSDVRGVGELLNLHTGAPVRYVSSLPGVFYVKLKEDDDE